MTQAATNREVWRAHAVVAAGGASCLPRPPEVPPPTTMATPLGGVANVGNHAPAHGPWAYARVCGCCSQRVRDPARRLLAEPGTGL